MKIERKIKTLEKEIEEIESKVYDIKNEKNLEQKYFLLQQKKDLAIRGIVLDLHLAIEDMLNIAIKNHLLGSNPRIQKKPWHTKSKTIHSIEDLLTSDKSIGFNNKLVLLMSAGLIRANLYNDLVKLNRLRNKCSHNWQLNMIIRRKVKRNKKKRPLLEYNGQSLYKKTVLSTFIEHYGPIYYNLWLKFSQF